MIPNPISEKRKSFVNRMKMGFTTGGLASNAVQVDNNQRSNDTTSGNNSTLSNMRAQNRQLSAKRIQDLRWGNLQGKMNETLELRRKLRVSQTAFILLVSQETGVAHHNRSNN